MCIFRDSGELERPPRQGFTRVALLSDKKDKALLHDEVMPAVLYEETHERKKARTSTSGEVLPPDSSTWGANMFAPKGNWKCRDCTASNLLEVTNCTCCTAPNDESQQF